MIENRKLYRIVSFILFLICVVILCIVDKTNNVKLSLAIQTIMIIYIARIAWGCILYIKKQYNERKYSYSIIMNLGLVLYLVLNIGRHINLLIINSGIVSINDIYTNTLNSFSYFILLILPFIIILAIYSIITNIVLIYKEGLRLQNILGIAFGVSILLGAAASQYIYEIIKNIEFVRFQKYIKKFIDIGLNSVLCYFYCITMATLYCNIIAARHKPNLDKDFVIILGAKIYSDGSLSPILKARVDKALEFAKKQKEKENKNIIFVPSGGQGKDEIIAEAEAMKKYLLENGIREEDILVENQSTSTLQNMKYSKKIIEKCNDHGKIIFSTTNYHVFRSGVIANNIGLDCEGMGSPTKWYFYTNALIREFIANLMNQKKEHFILVTFINVVLFILVIIGYKYNLM